MKKKLFIANWKNSGTSFEAEDFMINLLNFELREDENVVLAFPATYFYFYNKYKEKVDVKNLNKIFFASQDFSSFEKETVTGEISPEMLKEFNIKYSIIGHYERRFFLKEDKKIILRKIKNAIENNINPIICFGEDLTQRVSMKYESFLKKEIKFFLKEIKIFLEKSLFIKNNLEIILAYEPIWSIGSSVATRNEEIQEVLLFQNKIIKSLNFPENIKIINCYGGSVNENTMISIKKIDNLSTFLIGRASLKFDSFKKIVENARS